MFRMLDLTVAWCALRFLKVCVPLEWGANCPSWQSFTSLTFAIYSFATLKNVTQEHNALTHAGSIIGLFCSVANRQTMHFFRSTLLGREANPFGSVWCSNLLSAISRKKLFGLVEKATIQRIICLRSSFLISWSKSCWVAFIIPEMLQHLSCAKFILFLRFYTLLEQSQLEWLTCRSPVGFGPVVNPQIYLIWLLLDLISKWFDYWCEFLSFGKFVFPSNLGCPLGRFLR